MRRLWAARGLTSDRPAAWRGLPARKIHERLHRYLEQTLNPDDYPNLLDEYFRADGGRPPRSFDPKRPGAFLGTRAYARIRDAFASWVIGSVVPDPETESSPAYLSLREPMGLPRETWLIHFSDDADAVSREGFSYGHPRYRGLAYTNLKEDDRFSEPGFNYAFRASDSIVDSPAFGDGSGYGSLAVLFQSSGVMAYHRGDKAHEVIFWGPAVKRFSCFRSAASGAAQSACIGASRIASRSAFSFCTRKQAELRSGSPRARSPYAVALLAPSRVHEACREECTDPQPSPAPGASFRRGLVDP